MNKLLLVAGTIALLQAPALAGDNKQLRAPKKVAKVASVASLEGAKPIVETIAAATLPKLVEAAPELAPHDAVPAIPDLPQDLSSALVPFPELEKARPILAAAKKLAKRTKATVKLGANYVLGARQAAKPSDHSVERIVPKALTQVQVATVVQSHMDEVQMCWNAVPKTQRADATADLKLSISEAGAVTDIELGGNVPSSAHKCITSAVSRWAFPVAEAQSEIEYGIALRTL